MSVCVCVQFFSSSFIKPMCTAFICLHMCVFEFAITHARVFSKERCNRMTPKKQLAWVCIGSAAYRGSTTVDVQEFIVQDGTRSYIIKFERPLHDHASIIYIDLRLRRVRGCVRLYIWCVYLLRACFNVLVASLVH